jgi:hypothetical protein
MRDKSTDYKRLTLPHQIHPIELRGNGSLMLAGWFLPLLRVVGEETIPFLNVVFR